MIGGQKRPFFGVGDVSAGTALHILPSISAQVPTDKSGYLSPNLPLGVSSEEYVLNG